MLQDLERHRRLELPWLSGAVVRMGHALDVETPIHRFIATVLTPPCQRKGLFQTETPQAGSGPQAQAAVSGATIQTGGNPKVSCLR